MCKPHKAYIPVLLLLLITNLVVKYSIILEMLYASRNTLLANIKQVTPLSTLLYKALQGQKPRITIN